MLKGENADGPYMMVYISTKHVSGASHHLVVLLESGNHDDNAAPLLPHHIPEVPHSVHHRALGGDVGPLGPFVTLQQGEGDGFTQVSAVQSVLQGTDEITVGIIRHEEPGYKYREFHK